MQHLHDKRLFRHVIHLIREPLDAINSRFNNGTRRASGSTFAPTSQCNLALRPNASLSARDQNLQLALQHWVLWNSFVEATAEHHVSLERLDAVAVKDMLTLANLGHGTNLTTIRAALRAVSRSARAVNARHTVKARQLTWQDLAQIDPEYTALAQATALRHGYPVPPEARRRGLARCPQQQCGFTRQRKWGCSLVSR